MQEQTQTAPAAKHPIVDFWLSELSVVASHLFAMSRRVPEDLTTPLVKLQERVEIIASRLEQTTGMSPGRSKKVRLPRLFDLVIEALNARHGANGVTIQRVAEVSVPAVQADEAALLTQLYDLLDTAAREVPGNSITVRFRDEPLDALSLSIESLLPLPNVEALQEKMRRLSQLIDRKGDAYATSHLLRLLIREAGPRSRLDLKPVTDNEAQTDAAARKPLRVLMVDDDKPLRELVAEMLAPRGAVVDGAATMEQAEQLLNLHKYDLALVDVFLGDEIGTDAIGLFDHLQEGLSRRTIYCTGAVVRNQLKRFLHEHDLPLLSKPFDAGTLARAVRQVLARAGGPVTHSATA